MDLSKLINKSFNERLSENAEAPKAVADKPNQTWTWTKQESLQMKNYQKINEAVASITEGMDGLFESLIEDLDDGAEDEKKEIDECDAEVKEEGESWIDEEGNEWMAGEWEEVDAIEEYAAPDAPAKKVRKKSEWLNKLVKNPRTGRTVKVSSLPASERAKYNPRVTKKAAQDHEQGFKKDVAARNKARDNKKKIPSYKSDYNDHLKKAADAHVQKRDKGERHVSQFSDSKEFNLDHIDSINEHVEKIITGEND